MWFERLITSDGQVAIARDIVRRRVRVDAKDAFEPHCTVSAPVRDPYRSGCERVAVCDAALFANATEQTIQPADQRSRQSAPRWECDSCMIESMATPRPQG